MTSTAGLYTQGNLHVGGDSTTDGNATTTGTIDGSQYCISGTDCITDWASGINYWTQDGTDLYYNTGNVGIGTASPDNKLHIQESDASVSSPGDSILSVEENDDTAIAILTPNDKSGKIYFGDDGDNDIGRMIYDHSANDLSFWTLANERLTIDSDGNVGIGTSTPIATLHVEGDIAIETGTAVSPTLFHDSDIDTGLFFFNNTGHMGFSSDGSERFRIEPTEVVVNDSSLNVDFRVESDNQASMLRVDAGNDRVGIGDASPDGLFEVSTSTHQSMLVVSHLTGNVGIGTASPEAKLSVVGQTSTAPSLSGLTGAGLGLDFSNTLNIGIGSDPISPYGGWIQVSNGGGAAFPLLLNPLGGNVGIGTASPGAELDIAGSIDLTGDIYHTPDTNFYIKSDANMIYMADENSGSTSYHIWRFNGNANNVMLLDESPKLTLNGDFEASGTASTSALIVGDGNADFNGQVNLKGLSATESQVLRFHDTGGLEWHQWYDGGGLAFIESGINTHLYLEDGGNVGIGTASPQSKLSVFDTVNGEQIEFGYADIYSITMERDLSSNFNILRSHGSTATTTIFTIQIDNDTILAPNGDNVGIGLSSPTTTLSVNGAISRKGYFYAYSSAEIAGSTSWSILDNDTVAMIDSNYYSESAGTVTILKSGWYKVEFSCQPQLDSDTRYWAKCGIYDGGTQLHRGTGGGYVRQIAAPGTSITRSLLHYFTASDTLSLRGDVEHDAVDWGGASNEEPTNLIIEFIQD